MASGVELHYDAQACRHSSLSEALATRRSGVLYTYKRYANAIKRQLIYQHARSVGCLVDVGCGRGGDIGKWRDAGIRRVVAMDLSAAQLEEARGRENDRQRVPSQTQIVWRQHSMLDPELAALLAPQLRWAGAEGGADAVAAMFCIQFAFGSEATASILMAQVSSLLKPGGVFFGTAPDASAVLKVLDGRNSVTLEPPEFPFVLRLKRVDVDAVPKGTRSDGTNEMREGIEPQMAHRTRAAEGGQTADMVPETGRRDGKRGDGGSVMEHCVGGKDTLPDGAPNLEPKAKTNACIEHAQNAQPDAQANAGGKTQDGEGTSTSSLRIGPQHDDEFGHGLCFSLQDTVTQDSDDLTDAHEYLVWRETLTRLAEVHGLVPIAIESMYSHSAVGKMRGKDGRGGQSLPVLNDKEAQVAQLYFSFAFRKQAGRVSSTDMAPSGVDWLSNRGDHQSRKRGRSDGGSQLFDRHPAINDERGQRNWHSMAYGNQGCAHASGYDGPSQYRWHRHGDIESGYAGRLAETSSSREGAYGHNRVNSRWGHVGSKRDADGELVRGPRPARYSSAPQCGFQKYQDHAPSWYDQGGGMSYDADRKDEQRWHEHQQYAGSVSRKKSRHGEGEGHRSYESGVHMRSERDDHHERRGLNRFDGRNSHHDQGGGDRRGDR